MIITRQFAARLAAACGFVASLILSILFISPLPPLAISAPADVFSAERAMRDLEFIAGEPHPMGVSPAHAAARDYLLEQIRAAGIEPQVQDTIGVREFSGAILGGNVENIVARLPGSNPSGALLLISHYDSTPGGPGGVDSGSGVVTILEVLRALAAGPQLLQDVIVLFSDGEEPGLIGSNAFVDQHPWFKDVEYVLNMDQFLIGPPAVFRTSQGTGVIARALARSALRPAYMSLPFDLFPGGDTDLVPFMEAGIPGADIASGGIFPEKHTMLDRPELVDLASLQLAGDQMLALARELGDQPALAPDLPDETFFPFLGRLAHYPVSWAMPLAVAAGLIYLGTVGYGFGRAGLAWRGFAWGLLVWLLVMVFSLGSTYLIWLGIQTLHPAYQYSSVRLHLSDDWLYAAGMISLVFMVSAAVLSWARKHASPQDLAAGSLLIWLPAALAAAALFPETSYLTSWILLSGSLALLWSLLCRAGLVSENWDWPGYLISSIAACFLLIPVIYTAFQGAGFPMLGLFIALAALLAIALIPFLDWLTREGGWLFTAISLLAALAFLTAGHFLVGRDSPPPLVNSIGYWMEAESGEAVWIAFIGGYRTDAVTTARYQVAFPEEMDQRQASLLADPTRRPYQELLPAAPPFSVLTSPAPPLDQEGPLLVVQEDTLTEEGRLLQIAISGSLHDRLYLIISEAVRVLEFSLLENEGLRVLDYQGRYTLRFDGMPLAGLQIGILVDSADPFEILLVEEKTGLPVFPGLDTQAEPGSMRSPGEFLQGDATDFTVINRDYLIPAWGQ